VRHVCFNDLRELLEMNLPPAPPPPPEEVKLDTRQIGRRWKEPYEVVEKILAQGGVTFLEIPQPPRRGITLAALLEFEAQWRRTQAEQQARWKAECEEMERRQSEARERLAQRQAEADKLVAEAATQ
jgi:hypothetical protein